MMQEEHSIIKNNEFGSLFPSHPLFNMEVDSGVDNDLEELECVPSTISCSQYTI